MIASSPEQRNAYKGSPPRTWLRLRMVASAGENIDLDLLADTGNPCAVILSQATMTKLKQADALDITSNFGLLEGGWVRIHMPEFGLDRLLVGYASDAVVTAAKTSSSDFEGLVGLPLLRLAEYGGNADWFWLRPSNVPV